MLFLVLGFATGRMLKWGNLGPIPYVFPFYIATLEAIPAIIAAELAACFARLTAAPDRSVD